MALENLDLKKLASVIVQIIENRRSDPPEKFLKDLESIKDAPTFKDIHSLTAIRRFGEQEYYIFLNVFDTISEQQKVQFTKYFKQAISDKIEETKRGAEKVMKLRERNRDLNNTKEFYLNIDGNWDAQDFGDFFEAITNLRDVLFFIQTKKDIYKVSDDSPLKKTHNIRVEKIQYGSPGFVQFLIDHLESSIIIGDAIISSAVALITIIDRIIKKKEKEKNELFELILREIKIDGDEIDVETKLELHGKFISALKTMRKFADKNMLKEASRNKKYSKDKGPSM